MNKKYFFIILAIAVLAVGYFWVSSEREVVNYPPKNTTIVAFGDSLVRGVGSTGGGFVAQLSEKIGRQIINLGISGETSGQGLGRVDDVISRNPGTVLVLFGGNDYMRKVPKAETFQNLRQIVSRLQSSGAMVVLFGVRGGVLSDGFGNDFKIWPKRPAPYTCRIF